MSSKEWDVVVKSANCSAIKSGNDSSPECLCPNECAPKGAESALFDAVDVTDMLAVDMIPKLSKDSDVSWPFVLFASGALGGHPG